VKHLEPPDNLNEYIPDFLLFDIGFSFLVVAYFLEDISIISILHDQAAQISNC